MVSLPDARLPYAQATPAQRSQVLGYLQTRLYCHFPTLPERTFARALAEFQPDLRLAATQVSIPDSDLLQLVQYLAGSPELALLDPPLFGPWALELAQYVLHSSELAAGVILELAAREYPRCPPQLWGLLQRLAAPPPLAERVVQAHRWDLPGSPPLPAGRPGGGPAPGSPLVTDLLYRLRSFDRR